eukprot:4077080-Ditylum_brightwellii.AAC.1
MSGLPAEQSTSNLIWWKTPPQLLWLLPHCCHIFTVISSTTITPSSTTNTTEMPPPPNCQTSKQARYEQMEKQALCNMGERNARNKKQEAQS